jgi:hypothetical protein
MEANLIAAIIDKINNGDVPEFDEIGVVFPDQKWMIRMACFGSSDASMAAASAILGPGYQWHVGYDNKAVVRHKQDPMNPVSAISVSPGHALILAALKMRYEMEQNK